MYRYTFYFSNKQQGWSETLFRANAFGDGEGVFLDNYINRRLEALATTCYLIGVRGSNTDSKRDVIIKDLPSGGRGGAWSTGGSGTSTDPGLPTQTEDTFTALLLRLSDGQQNYRSFPFLGIPDGILQYNQIVPGEEAGVRSRLNNWIGSITSASFGMKLQDVPTISGRIVDFYPKTEANQLVCLGITGTPPAVGDHVILGSVKGFPKLNRAWKVAAVTAAAGAVPAYIYLSGSSQLNAYNPVQGGVWKKPAYRLAVLNTYTISRLTSRKTGVPFDVVRGRR